MRSMLWHLGYLGTTSAFNVRYQAVICLLQSLRNSDCVPDSFGGIKPGTSAVRSRSAKRRCGTFRQRNGLTPLTFTLYTASFHITKLGRLPHDVFLSSVRSSELAKMEGNCAVLGYYHYSLGNSPEKRSSHPLRGGSLKSRKQKRFSQAAVS